MSCEAQIHASAPAKIILLGEHAVVYGEPAIAAPVLSLRARATAYRKASPLTLNALDLKRRIVIGETDSSHPLAILLRRVADQLAIDQPSGEIRLTSDIPIASGLGSGAAVSAAVARAIAQFHQRQLPDSVLNELVYEIEGLHHGTPSGIDNTVVVHEAAVLYAKASGFTPLSIGAPFHFLIADTGLPASTMDAVARVRQRHAAKIKATEAIFARIGSLVHQARICLESGDAPGLGLLMSQNQRQLQRLDVSSPELDALIQAASSSGALGAKLSGGGLGGCMIALVDETTKAAVSQSLIAAGATRVMPFVLQATERA